MRLPSHRAYLVILLFCVLLPSACGQSRFSDLQEGRSISLQAVGEVTYDSGRVTVHGAGELLSIDIDTGVAETVFKGFRPPIRHIVTSSAISAGGGHMFSYIDDSTGLHTIIRTSDSERAVEVPIEEALATRFETEVIAGVPYNFALLDENTVLCILGLRDFSYDSPAGFAVRKDIVAIKLNEPASYTLVQGKPSGIRYLAAEGRLVWYIPDDETEGALTFSAARIQNDNTVSVGDVRTYTISSTAQRLRLLNISSGEVFVSDGEAVYRVNREHEVERIIDRESAPQFVGTFVYVSSDLVITRESEGLQLTIHIYR